MSVSIYPVLNKDVVGFDVTEISGKALAAAIFAPDSTFAVVGNFYSANEDELREFIAGETRQDMGEIEVPAEEWFSPEEGLVVVRELFTQPATTLAGSDAGDFAEWLANDLRFLEKNAGAGAGTRGLVSSGNGFLGRVPISAKNGNKQVSERSVARQAHADMKNVTNQAGNAKEIDR